MKKVLFVLIGLMLFSTACSKDDKQVVQDNHDDTNIIAKNQNDNTVITQPKEKQDEKELKGNPLEDLVKHFENNGFTIGEKAFKAFEMVGAVDGFGIEINGEFIELYLYEPDSPALEEIKSTGQYNMDGFLINAKLNGNIALMGYEGHPEATKIEEVFNNFN